LFAVVPEAHRTFVDQAIPILQQDPRILGLAVGGSWISGQLDEFSDVDLVVVMREASFAEVMDERRTIAARLGTLLEAFTGEHVGEPRLLICLYDQPLLHVDLKFVTLPQLSNRVEDPVVLWERERLLTECVRASVARYPSPDLQWIEDRFWIWVHYAATKIGRGELFECIDFLAYLRRTALGPLWAVKSGNPPRGVRFLESWAGSEMPAFLATLPTHEKQSCIDAVLAAVDMYRTVRDHLAGPTFLRNARAEEAAVAYVARVDGQSRRLPSQGSA
jgi:predicted nucleotidyltransferase